MRIKNKGLAWFMIPILIIQLYFMIPDANFFLMAKTMPAIMISILLFDLIVTTLLIYLLTTTIERTEKNE